MSLPALATRIFAGAQAIKGLLGERQETRPGASPQTVVPTGRDDHLSDVRRRVIEKIFSRAGTRADGRRRASPAPRASTPSKPSGTIDEAIRSARVSVGAALDGAAAALVTSGASLSTAIDDNSERVSSSIDKLLLILKTRAFLDGSRRDHARSSVPLVSPGGEDDDFVIPPFLKSRPAPAGKGGARSRIQSLLGKTRGIVGGALTALKGAGGTVAGTVAYILGEWLVKAGVDAINDVVHPLLGVTEEDRQRASRLMSGEDGSLPSMLDNLWGIMGALGSAPAQTAGDGSPRRRRRILFKGRKISFKAGKLRTARGYANMGSVLESGGITGGGSSSWGTGRAPQGPPGWGRGSPMTGPGAVQGGAVEPMDGPVPNVAQAQAARAEVRKMPIQDDLQAHIGEAVMMTLGEGYTAEVYSGGQPAPGEGGRRVGSTRHDHGRAADLIIRRPDGTMATQEEYARVGQHWTANRIGGVGLQMSGGGIHLDTHSDRAPFWTYDDQRGIPVKPENAELVRRGIQGVAPEYKMTREEARARLSGAGAEPVTVAEQKLPSGPGMGALVRPDRSPPAIVPPPMKERARPAPPRAAKKEKKKFTEAEGESSEDDPFPGPPRKGMSFAAYLGVDNEEE